MQRNIALLRFALTWSITMPDLDHREMSPPFLRQTYAFQLNDAAGITVWHLRVAQPNVSHLSHPAIHSVEHFLGDWLPQVSRDVFLVAPMGCHTGFYVVTSARETFHDLADSLADVLARITTATEVPHANTRDCGWAERHSLAGAQAAAAWLLARQADWQRATLAPVET